MASGAAVAMPRGPFPTDEPIPVPSTFKSSFAQTVSTLRRYAQWASNCVTAFGAATFLRLHCPPPSPVLKLTATQLQRRHVNGEEAVVNQYQWLIIRHIQHQQTRAPRSELSVRRGGGRQLRDARHDSIEYTPLGDRSVWVAVKDANHPARSHTAGHNL